MYDDILLPFDGSDGAAEALHHAAEIANWAGATVRILFVADTTRDSLTVVESDVVDALEQEGRQVVEEASKTLATLGADHTTDVVQGNPAPTIADYADSYEYDLIVMPTLGRTGMSRYLVGSVTEKVVRLSSVPVLTLRMQSDEQLTFPYENILVPTDSSTGATRAADHGLALASSTDATVHVLSVVNETALGLDVRSVITTQERERLADEVIEDIVSRADGLDVSDVVTHVERGTPADVIRQTIDSADVDAVVMGTTGRRGTDRILLGSVAEETVRTAPVPVITVGGTE